MNRNVVCWLRLALALGLGSGAAWSQDRSAEPSLKPPQAVLRPSRATVDLITPAPYSRAAIEERQQQLLANAPPGARLAAYLDCGVEAESADAFPVKLRQLNGATRQFPGSAEVDSGPLGTVAWEAQRLAFEAAGLDPKKTYLLGFSWWDFDDSRRVQAVRLEGAVPADSQTIVPPTRLPVYKARQQRAVEMELPLAPQGYASGKLRIIFQRDEGNNTVASEVWLWEGKGRTSLARPGTKEPQGRVLLVTGIDYPGHVWKETAPVLAEQLRQDRRLQVSVVEDPGFLGNPALHGFDVVVMHWMNWEKPAPGPAARENLRRFVEGGKGMALVHFACGAFQDWAEFRNLAGRAYDPKLPPHDPRGPYQVSITSIPHPITQGLQAFEADDELYTCLAGERPIDILATAHSKVTGKDHPMAFVFNYGKGRVFHSPLGHDVKALSIPMVGELFRRGCAWAAGLPPIGE
jgi:type 1 glutamine amidotransferase